jgi:anti-anti-sigma factor
MPQFEHSALTRNRARPFKLNERRIWPGCIEIEVEGELDLAVSDRLREALDAASERPCHVLVGLGACDFIDASGLAVLVTASRAFAARGRQLLLYGVHGQVRRMLTVTGLTENGLRVTAGDASALPVAEETVPGGDFSVTLANEGSARLSPLSSSLG